MINNCKDIKDYLKLCNVDTIDKLSDSQVMAWAKSGKMGLNTKSSIDYVENGEYGRKPDYNKAIRILRQALRENMEFICAFVFNESCDGPIITDGNEFEYFEMYLDDKEY